MKENTGLRSLLGAAASMVAAIAALSMLIVMVSPPPVNAETPAERCKRETTTYNNAWKNSWAQANPGKSPSQAPPPPVPYKCGGSNDGPPPTVAPTTTSPEPRPEDATVSTPKAPSGEALAPVGPSLNPPKERRDLEHPDQAQAPIHDYRRTPGRVPVAEGDERRAMNCSPWEFSGEWEAPHDPMNGGLGTRGCVEKSEGEAKKAMEKQCQGVALTPGQAQEVIGRHEWGWCYTVTSVKKTIPDYSREVGGCRAMSPDVKCTAIATGSISESVEKTDTRTTSKTSGWNVNLMGSLSNEFASVGTTLGVDRSTTEAVSSALSRGKTVSYSNSSSCESPLLDEGQVFVAYPTYDEVHFRVFRYDTDESYPGVLKKPSPLIECKVN